jgi:hypothetical protein
MINEGPIDEEHALHDALHLHAASAGNVVAMDEDGATRLVVLITEGHSETGETFRHEYVLDVDDVLMLIGSVMYSAHHTFGPPADAAALAMLKRITMGDPLENAYDGYNETT